MYIVTSIISQPSFSVNDRVLIFVMESDKSIDKRKATY